MRPTPFRFAALRVPVLPVLAGAVLLVGGLSMSAFGADTQGAKGPSESVFIAEIVALLLCGRLLGEVMLRLGQPAVVGQLLAGIVLGPSVFGLLAPHWHAAIFPSDAAQKAMIDGVAKLGVLLLLLLTGMETDIKLVRAVGRPAASVSLMGIAVPFCCGLLVGLFVLPDSLLPTPEKRLVTALFLGTALSISSIKIVAMVVDEMHFMRRNLGQIIVASAIIDDTIGWIIVAVTFGLAQPGGLNLGSLALSLGGTALFVLFSATLGRRLVAAVMRWTNDRFVSDLPAVTAILIIMGLMALATDALGVNTVLGAFMAGVLVGQSPILTKRVEGEVRGLVVALFAPVFFGIAGLGTDLTILKDPTLLALTAGLVLVASLGKFAGAFAGGKIGGLNLPESFALALGMNARGSTEVIVATIGLGIGALNNTLFTMIVTMAVVTTTAMPPTLRWALARLPMRKEEADRLDREAFDATGFVSNVERLLVARDEGASGVLAARLAGLIGGPRDLPITVMPVGASAGRPAEPASSLEPAEAAAAAAREHMPSEARASAAPIDTTLRPVQAGADHEAVGAEARKGYGLLIIGREPATTPDGDLHPGLVDLIGSFGGPRAVVVARGMHRENPGEGPLNVLIPTGGTDISTRAAEMGFAIAQGQNTTAAVLVVAEQQGAGRSQDRRPEPRKGAPGREVLSALAKVAERFDVEAETVQRVSDDKVAAVLGQARRHGHTLIVLGVSSRVSQTRPFGALAHGLLEGSEHSLLLVIQDSGHAAA